jgi:glucose/mannose-6-phosphate isomerase
MRISRPESALTHTDVLDVEATFTRLDPTGLRNRQRALPDHCREAWQQAKGLSTPEEWSTINKVVIGGMGGSAIAGDLVADLAALQQSLPVLVVRDFSLPFRLDQNSLFIGCSHSGSTEETLSLFRQARQQNAQILAVAGGGVLLAEAASDGIPSLTINAPGEPRSAVGYNLMLLLGALNNCGIAKTDQSEVETTIAALQALVSQLSEGVPAKGNPAKQIAQELPGKLILVYGGGFFTGMARRWKTQLNENAKAWAFFETLPELLHNSVESFNTTPKSLQDKYVLVLKPNTENKDLESRYRVIAELLKQKDIPHRIIDAGQAPPLSQMLNMLILGDYVSYYLAMLRGIDPSPIPAISLGKELIGS